MRLNAPDKRMLHSIAEKINSSYAQNHTISALAAMANMSESKFKTGFYILFGKPVHQYMLQQKMKFALEKIEEDELSLAQIAKHCGYKHTTNFIAAFKKVYGYTPGRAKPGQV